MRRNNVKDKGFTDAYNEFFPLVYSAVYAKLGKTGDTEDICQEVFVRFYNKLDEIENNRKWLFGTMRYVLLEHYRKKSGTDQETELNEAEAVYVNGFRDIRIILEQAMDELNQSEDSDLRTVFDYVAVNSFTYRETGQHLGLTEQQVRYRYEKAVKELMNHLKNKGISNLEDLL